jgi:hypothetical protein
MTIRYQEIERTRFEAVISDPTPVGEVMESIKLLQDKWFKMYGSDVNEIGPQEDINSAITLDVDAKYGSPTLLIGFSAWTSSSGFDIKEKEEVQA